MFEFMYYLSLILVLQRILFLFFRTLMVKYPSMELLGPIAQKKKKNPLIDIAIFDLNEYAVHLLN